MAVPDSSFGEIRHCRPPGFVKTGQLSLVGLKLLPSGPDSSVLVGRVLQFDNAQGQAVREQHNVGAARIAVFGNAELVGCQPIVGFQGVGVNNLGLLSLDGAINDLILNLNALTSIRRKERLRASSVVPRRGFSRTRASRSLRLTVVVALRAWRIRTNIWSVRHLPDKVASSTSDSTNVAWNPLCLWSLCQWRRQSGPLGCRRPA